MAIDRQRGRIAERAGPWAAVAPVVAFVLLFALVPVGVLVAAGWGPAGGWAGVARVAADPLNQAALAHSLEQGALSALAAVAVGYPAGLFLGRYEWRGRSWVRGLLLVPFLLPVLVVVLAIEDLFGAGTGLGAAVPAAAWFAHGVPGIVAVNVVFNTPIVILLTAVGVESSRTDLEEEARLLGASPGRAYREVWGPPSWVGGLAGGLLTFLFSALAFAAPILMCGARCYTLEARVWSLDVVLLQPAAASVLAAAMVLFLAVPTAAYLWLVHRLRAAPGRARRRAVDWRAPGPALLGAWTVALLVGIAAVLASVLVRSVVPGGNGAVTASGWSALFAPATTSALGVAATTAVANTLALAVGGALVAVLLGVVSGYVVTTRPRLAGALRFVLFLPLLISPIVLSFSLAEFWRPLLGGASSVWALILLSQATLALPFALQTLYVALREAPRAGAESARLLGASPWRAYVDVDLTGASGALTAAALFAFALCLGEFTATYFLATPAFTTLPVLLFDLESVRQTAAADAAAALLLLVSLATLAAAAQRGRGVEL